MLKLAGIERKRTILIVSDAQKLSEQMYENLSNLLNNGEISNLFSMEEKLKICEDVTSHIPIGTTN